MSHHKLRLPRYKQSRLRNQHASVRGQFGPWLQSLYICSQCEPMSLRRIFLENGVFPHCGGSSESVKVSQQPPSGLNSWLCDVETPTNKYTRGMKQWAHANTHTHTQLQNSLAMSAASIKISITILLGFFLFF